MKTYTKTYEPRDPHIESDQSVLKALKIPCHCSHTYWNGSKVTVTAWPGTVVDESYLDQTNFEEKDEWGMDDNLPVGVAPV